MLDANLVMGHAKKEELSAQEAKTTYYLNANFLNADFTSLSDAEGSKPRA